MLPLTFTNYSSSSAARLITAGSLIATARHEPLKTRANELKYSKAKLFNKKNCELPRNIKCNSTSTLCSTRVKSEKRISRCFQPKKEQTVVASTKNSTVISRKKLLEEDVTATKTLKRREMRKCKTRYYKQNHPRPAGSSCNYTYLDFVKGRTSRNLTASLKSNSHLSNLPLTNSANRVSSFLSPKKILAGITVLTGVKIFFLKN